MLSEKEIIKKIRHIEIKTKKRVDSVFTGNYKSAFRGQGYEFSDLRQYEEGDDARYIDWITSAKQGKPFVKKFEESRELTTFIVLDVSFAMHFSSEKKKKSEIALELASTLLFSALKNNDKFGLILFADKVKSFIPPKKGRSHFLKIIRELILAFDEQKNKTKAELKNVLDFINSNLKTRSICFFITDDISVVKKSPSTLRALKIANIKNDFLYFKVFDKMEERIDKKMPALKILDMKSDSWGYFDFENKNFIKEYNKLRAKKLFEEKKILKQLKINYLKFNARSNIYKNLLLFFKSI